MLRKEKVAPDVQLDMLAAATEGFTGSDIRELVRIANLQRLKELSSRSDELTAHALTADRKDGAIAAAQPAAIVPAAMLPLSTSHFDVSLRRMRAARADVANYNRNLTVSEVSDRLMLSQGLAVLQNAMNQSEEKAISEGVAPTLD
jgi:SpoVK/Ycf46/Vps4 family AAA+-type ATPase